MRSLTTMGSGSEEQGSELPLSAISLEAEFASFVAAPTFPCLGAKAAFNAGSYLVSVYDQLASDRSSKALATGLEDFTRSEIRRTNEYATFAAIFRQPRSLDEKDFERLLWLQLQKLHQIDATRYTWDPSVFPVSPRTGKTVRVASSRQRSTCRNSESA